MKKKWLSILLCALLMGGCAADTANAPTATPPAALPATADITVMSWNILNPAWGGTPASMRIDGVVNTVEAVMPDVIGFQEVGPQWHEEWAALPAQYAAVNTETADGLDYMTVLMYNTDTLVLNQCGVKDLDPGSDIRIVAWAVLTVKDTAASFLITNTHPHATEYQCLLHTAAYIEIVKDLRVAHPLPLICVGDFNAVEDSKAYRMHTGDRFTDAKYADGVTLISDKDSYLNGHFGGTVSSGLGSRDHIFVKGDVTPLTFETLYKDGVDKLSDHLPIVATLTVGA